MDKAIRILLFTTLQILICLVTVGIYHKALPTNNIISVDLNTIMKNELIKLAEKDMNELQRQEALKRLSMKLKDAFQVLSNDGKNAILIKEVVLNGAKDETDWVYEWLRKDEVKKDS